jgi:Zn-finger nucleic acid-binding protein
MLKMKGDLDELLKTKRKRKSKTIDLDECLKIKGLRDNRGEARMLLKRNGFIALFSAKRHNFLRIPQARRSNAPPHHEPPNPTASTSAPTGQLEVPKQLFRLACTFAPGGHVIDYASIIKDCSASGVPS